MKRFLREPLLHFLLLGAAIFVVYGQVAKRSRGREPGKVVISTGQIAAMAEGFTLTWRRPPTREELEGLIRDRVQEEVYSREAVALGLGKDDTIIRRRLRQKLEFLTDDVAALAEPTEAELGAYLQSHADMFRVQRAFTFRQVYLSPARHGDHLARDVAELLGHLRQAGEAADLAALGDAFLLDQSFRSLPAGEVTKLFGESFAAKLAELKPGQWQGPVESGYGVHLVLVTARTAGHLPPLAEIREAVRREWANTRRLESNAKLYEEMLKHYDVIIESLPPAGGGRMVAR